MFDYNLAERRISAADVHAVSFDVFDTLLRRRVMHPHHVFWFTEAILRKEPATRMGALNFACAREHASHLSIRHQNLHGREDSTIDDIFDFIGAMLPDLRPNIRRAREVELELERNLLEPYPLGQSLFNAALKAGKRIVLTSDQYLPKQFILDQLKAAGYEGFEELFLSGNLGALKVTGTLFDWLPLRLNLPRSQIIHVGDNEHADYASPRRKGLQALLIPKSVDFAQHAGVGSAICRHSTLSSFAAATYFNERTDAVLSGSHPPSQDNMDFIGYALLGPLLVGLSQWIADQLKEGEIDRIWFLSRDGEILSKAFAVLYPEFVKDADYVYASRRLIVYPTATLSGDEVFRHYRQLDRPDVSVHQFIDAIEGLATKLEQVRRQFSPEDKLGNCGTKERFKYLLNRVGYDGLSGESAEISNIRQYYADHIKGAKRLGIFDIGWKGNLQRGLDRLLIEQDVKILGYYLGLMFEDVVPKQLVDARSYAFNLNFPHDVFSDLNQCIWIIETLFAGAHPSVVGIEKKETGWKPVFENEGPFKRALRLRAEHVQQAAMRFVCKVASQDKVIVDRIVDRDQIVEALREFIARPAHFDGGAYASFGWTPNIDETSMQIVARPAGKKRKQFKLARRQSAWRAGFNAFHGELRKRRWRR